MVCFLNELHCEKTCLMRTTKVQISTFIGRCLDSIVPVVAMYETARIQLASVADRTPPKTGFLMTWLK